ncbi:MAG: hypothetical protein GXP28_10535 [Planctomycetes bacterium]|nr:hypothetical protein [Planctomycetota bacterium]
MSELVPSEIIEKLEERHERLIAELDELNNRLEKALNSFVKPAEKDEIRSQTPNAPLATHDS